MSEYIIKDLTKKEEKILEEHDIDFCIDDLFSDSRDINIQCSHRRFKEILHLIGRETSFPSDRI